MNRVQPTGTFGFLLIWAGQLVSMIGTNMTRFAMAIWVWQQTGSASALTLIGVSALIPALLTGFIAGPLVDRWDRKRLMMVGDLTAGIVTVVLLLLYSSGSLAVWHLYVASAITSIAGSFQGLAYSVTITLMLPRSQYTRASAMNSLAEYGSRIGAPLLAGVLLAPIGVLGIMLIDIVTFVVAISALLIVHIPRPPKREPETQQKTSFWADATYGFRYIFQYPALRGLLAIVFTFSMAESLGYPLIVPMILARTGDNEVILGTVQSFLGVGGVIGGLLVTIWGGPKRRIHAILIGLALTGLLGDALFGVGQSLPMWIAAALGLEVFIPLTLGAYQSIWQSKIPPEIQGRVFAARGLMTSVAEPLSMIFAGVLVDRVLEPAMLPNSALAASWGWLVGTGAGAGMGLLLVFCGIGSALAGISGYFIYSVRNVEDIIPDHDAEALHTAP